MSDFPRTIKWPDPQPGAMAFRTLCLGLVSSIPARCRYSGERRNPENPRHRPTLLRQDYPVSGLRRKDDFLGPLALKYDCP